MDKIDFTGRVAIVTGAGGGLGRLHALGLAARGAKVLVNDLGGAVDGSGGSATAAQKVVDEIKAAGGEAIANGASVTDFDAVQAMVQQAIDAWDRVDIVVNNAGVGHTPQPLDELSDEAFDRIAAVNMRAIYLMSRAFVPAMKAQGSGAILNIASTGGVSPRPNLTWYNASKGWVITATRAMAVELAPFQVRVNALNPVAGDTPLLKTFMGADTPEVRAKFLASIPIGRFSTPEDMGAAAAFLCSDDASMITGVALEVDGGRCI